jgi:pimeloyl-ACP methyl ester carboxylesterase
MRSDYTQPPFDRSPTNGFRLATYPGIDQKLSQARLPIPETPPPDLLHAKPVPDDVFAVYRRMYTYDRTPLNANVESADTTPNWIRQKIAFDAAYGHERMILYLYLPKTVKRPLQTIVYFPGSAAAVFKSVDQWRTIHLDFLIKSGRAFAFPMYKGTFERIDGPRLDAAGLDMARRARFLQVALDLRRSIDYLETRSEVDSSKLAYYGYSWGSRVGPMMLAVEPRLKAAILYIAGISFQRSQPEVDELNFVSRVKVPVLMLSGRFDEVFPLETSAKPMFQLLGTPPDKKKHVISDGGHFVPRPQFIRETLDWLDRYLGPVR